LAVEGAVRVDDALSFGLIRDCAEQTFRKPLDCPIRTERGSKKIAYDVLGIHNGITRFVRFGHSVRNSDSPLSASKRISPLLAKPAAIGSASRIAMIQAGTLTSKIAGPSSSGKSACLFRAAISGVPVLQGRPSPMTVEKPSAGGSRRLPGSR